MTGNTRDSLIFNRSDRTEGEESSGWRDESEGKGWWVVALFGNCPRVTRTKKQFLPER